MPGWCNGNAGHVHLWTTAHETYADPRYLELATKAAWGMWEQPVNFNNVCCGAAGCAYAMLNMHRHTGDKDWLRRARHYAHRVATHPDRPSDNPGDVHSLYKGDVGLMLLLDEIRIPPSRGCPCSNNRRPGWRSDTGRRGDARQRICPFCALITTATWSTA